MGSILHCAFLVKQRRRVKIVIFLVSDGTLAQCSHGFGASFACVTGPKQRYSSNALNMLFLKPRKPTLYHDIRVLCVSDQSPYCEWFIFCCASDPHNASCPNMFVHVYVSDPQEDPMVKLIQIVCCVFLNKQKTVMFKLSLIEQKLDAQMVSAFRWRFWSKASLLCKRCIPLC